MNFNKKSLSNFSHYKLEIQTWVGSLQTQPGKLCHFKGPTNNTLTLKNWPNKSVQYFT